jgi:hypothetical protein
VRKLPVATSPPVQLAEGARAILSVEIDQSGVKFGVGLNVVDVRDLQFSLVSRTLRCFVSSLLPQLLTFAWIRSACIGKIAHNG